MMSEADLQYENNHVWHPYSAIPNQRQVLPVVSASGVTLTLNDGRQLIDGTSSWWCAAHGYNVESINAAIRRQLDQMSHVMFGGLTHQPAITLTEMLLEMLPDRLEKVFYADSGSIAVEVALKMALQYYQGIGKNEKCRFMTVCGGYHGDTIGTMAFCDPAGGMHNTLRGVLPKHIFAPRPSCKFGEAWNPDSMQEVAALLAKHHQETAAFILEPIIQGAGGMYFYHEQFLIELAKLCKKYDVLLIFDEIATGFWRSGIDFAMNYAHVVPDILCLGKALTGGAITLAATICSAKVGAGVSAGNPGVLLHGPTFMANPVACQAACASLQLFKERDYTNKVRAISEQLKLELAKCSQFDLIKEVRVLGATGVVELKYPAPPELQLEAVNRGVWLRPFGNIFYTMPPFVINEHELRKITGAMYEALGAISLKCNQTNNEYV
ncbi:MAG: adenosylmethionine--8-amino-7-oxononanoate transaminase [Lentisphaeria bacterium]|nr:adenosylmethionine--8-amino-7-oxononanoate transaminase [Lentisphaeria bacterium]